MVIGEYLPGEILYSRTFYVIFEILLISISLHLGALSKQEFYCASAVSLQAPTTQARLVPSFLIIVAWSTYAKYALNICRIRLPGTLRARTIPFIVCKTLHSLSPPHTPLHQSFYPKQEIRRKDREGLGAMTLAGLTLIFHVRVLERHRALTSFSPVSRLGSPRYSTSRLLFTV